MTWHTLVLTLDHLKFALVFLAWGIVSAIALSWNRAYPDDTND